MQRSVQKGNRPPISNLRTQLVQDHPIPKPNGVSIRGSQMTVGNIPEYQFPNLRLKRSVNAMRTRKLNKRTAVNGSDCQENARAAADGARQISSNRKQSKGGT